MLFYMAYHNQSNEADKEKSVKYMENKIEKICKKNFDNSLSG